MAGCASHQVVATTALLAVWAWSFLLASPAAAQVAWQYAPYNIEAWVDFAPAPEFTPRFEEETRRKLEQLAEIEVGAAWTLTATPLPAITRAQLLAYLDRAADPKLKTLDRPQADVRSVLQRDKLLVAEVEIVPAGYLVRVRELDCRTRVWSGVVEATAWQPAEIAYAIFAAAREAFVPLARIESTKEKVATLRLRAGGLLLGRPSPARVADGSVLLPVIRRNDRYGEPRPGGVLPVPWTFLRVESQTGALLTCEVSSGLRLPLGRGGTSRNERLALLAKARGESTSLVLKTRGTSPLPLVGYEVYEPGDDGEGSRLLGVTDWRGVLEVPRGDVPLRVLIVKSGGQLLARVPLVPGLASEVTAEISDDQKRLEAEGAVMGLNSNFLDVVARREMLAARIRRKIAARDFAAAQTLIEELRVLDSRSRLSERLDQFQRDYTSPDRKVQAKIDKMFSETRALFNKHLDTRLPDRLAGELARAREGRAG